MTAQVPDYVIYQDHKYALAGISDGELWQPQQAGIEPSMSSSGCWRGYIATFRVLKSRLELHELQLSLYDKVQLRTPPTIGKAKAKPMAQGSNNIHGHNWMYADIRLHQNYTGGLLLADGFIWDLYVHMGFQAAWKYRTVHELIFENGKLERAFDRSVEMWRTRKDMEGKPLKPDLNTDHAELMRWIEKTFSCKYGR